MPIACRPHSPRREFQLRAKTDILLAADAAIHHNSESVHIESIEPSPFHVFEHFAAASGGGVTSHPVQLYRGKAHGLPESLDALVLAADLQGMAPVPSLGGEWRLAGEALAEHLAEIAERGVVPPLSRTGVVLAGDMFSAPTADRRGASGDVRSVWRAFAARFRWVAGAAGNHDTFGETPEDEAAFAAEPRTHLLDGRSVLLDGLRIAGVGGTIGDPRKLGRRDEREFLRSMRHVLAERPDMLVMHHGPDAQRGKLRGHEKIRRALDGSGQLLVVCGHVYWPTPLADVRGGAQVLNVDGRVVVLARA